MRSQIFASALVAATGAAAQACMTSAEASAVAANFQHLIDEPFSTSLAEGALTANYVDWASGVATLINSGCNEPLDITAPTFTNLTSFIAGQSSQPPITFDILNLWNNCDTVMLRWRGSNLGPTQPPEDVTGMIILEVVPNPSSTTYPWQIETSYSEFNSGAWLYDLGVLKPNCTAPPPARLLRA